MKSKLPGLGINYAWIFIISNISSGIFTYKCIAGYDLQEPEREEPVEEIKENMIFNDLLSQKQDRSFSVQPLLFKDEKYGLMVTEVNEMAYPAYEIMSHYIGSTIKNILLGEEVVAMNRQLMRLNEQKTKFKQFCTKYVIVGRERKIVQMMIDGLTHKELASCLNLSQSAVEYHITKIYKKCGVNNKYNLIKKIQE